MHFLHSRRVDSPPRHCRENHGNSRSLIGFTQARKSAMYRRPKVLSDVEIDSLGPRLSALYAASFIGIGVYLAFFPVWLESRALSPALIGLIVAIPIVVRIVLTAPLLALADHSLGPRLLIAGACGPDCVSTAPGVDALGHRDGGGARGAALQVAIMPGNDLVARRPARQGTSITGGSGSGDRSRSWGRPSAGATSSTCSDRRSWSGPLLLAPSLGILATTGPSRGEEECKCPAVPGRRVSQVRPKFSG